MRPGNVVCEASDGDVIHYICQEGNLLSERDYDAGDLAPAEKVGVAKEGTQGALLVLGEKRALFCLDEHNTLQDFEFDDEDIEWRGGQLSNLGLKAAPDTQIAAAQVDERVYVICQSASDQRIQVAFQIEGNGWEVLSNLPPTDPSRGASLHALVFKSQPHIFYSHSDNSIHLLWLQDSGWVDHEVAGTDSPSPKSHIRAVVAEDKYSLRFVDGHGSAFGLDENGNPVLLGRWTENGFRKLTDAEGHGPKELKW